jgi:phosphoglycolate phosphatase
MTDNPGITLACFGVVGTLVADNGIVELAYAEAIATQGVVSGTSAFARSMAQVHRARGQAPVDVLTSLFPENQARAQAALLAFERSLAGAVGRTVATPIPGAKEVLSGLADSGVRICVMTSLPQRQLTVMLQACGWGEELIGSALTADDVPRGCPAPDLALAAMLRFGVGNVREVAMVQATGAGVGCGRRAGARLVAGVLTGPHPVARLRSAGATHILGSIADLPAVLTQIDAPESGAAAASAQQGGHAAGGRGSQLSDPVGISVPPQAPLQRRPLGYN